jgi:NAD binding domain of 6-phosphogluconate dehydrogenase
MGAEMARNLLKAGHRVTVYNRTRAKAQPLAAKGAQMAEQVADACRGEILITMLADDAAVEAVLFGEGGAGESLPAGAIHLSMNRGDLRCKILAAADLTCGRLDGDRVTGFARLTHPQSLSLILERASFTAAGGPKMADRDLAKEHLPLAGTRHASLVLPFDERCKNLIADRASGAIAIARVIKSKDSFVGGIGTAITPA